MSEIEKAIKHFENMRDDNFVVLDKFKKEIESGKVNGITTVYDNRHLYYSLAIEALHEKQEREKGRSECEPCCHNCKHDVYDDFCRYYGTHGCDKKHFEPKNKFCQNCGRKLGENDGH